MKKIIAVCILLLFLVISGFALLQYNKPHKNLRAIESEFVLSSGDLFSEYIQDELSADNKYLDKIIEVKGKIIEIQKDDNQISFLLEGSEDEFGFVTCSLNITEENKVNSFKPGDYATVKGICTGYLMDVVLNKCIIIN